MLQIKKWCMTALMFSCCIALAASAEKRPYPQISVTVYGDGKGLPNALVFMQVYVPGAEDCGSQWIKVGMTNQAGQILVRLTDADGVGDPTYSIYQSLLDKGSCQQNEFKGCFGRERGTGQTGLRVKVSAAGYKTGTDDQTYKGIFVQYKGHVYDPISIDLMLDKTQN